MLTRPATPQDIPFLIALRQDTMQQHLIASGVQTSPSYHRQRVLYHFECAQILLSQGRPVGLLKVSRQPGEWEIIQIQLTPELQGGGIGQRILNSLISEARDAGASIRLNVLKSNPARHLYTKLGFETIAQTSYEFIMVRNA